MTSTPTEKPLKTTALPLLIASGLGVIAAFVNTVIALKVLEAAMPNAALAGADNELGFPTSALAVALFAVPVASAVALLAGARVAQGWWTALAVILSLGVIVEVWATVLAFTPLLLVQLVLMAAALVVVARRVDRGIGFPVFLILASSVGFFAAFRLTVDKVQTFVDPTAPLSCNTSFLVQCGVNLASPQGAVLGFPNPLLGIGGWIAPLAVGIMMLAGARFSRWFWIAFNVGLLAALVLVIWLIGQSIFVLGTLCPWCMVTWAVTIPTFLLVTSRNLKSGTIPLPAGGQRFFSAVYAFVPLITLLCYVVIGILAQVQLDVLHRL